MSANDWLHLDWVLSVAEVVLVPLTIAYLILAAVRGSRARVTRALILAGVVGLTLAQPLGVKGVPISPQEFAEGDPRPVDPEAVHSVQLLGVPLFGFRPYTQEIFYLNGEGGYPTDWLKVRSWLWPGLLTNGAKVERLCGNTGQPCWVPEGQDQESIRRTSKNLQLVEADGEWRYRILTSDGRPPKYPPGYLDSDEDSIYHYNGYYRLAVGIVSVPGLVYWLLVAGPAGLILALRRPGEDNEQITHPDSPER